MNWIDTPLLGYSLVDGHPAQQRVARALAQDRWGSSVLVLLEVYHLLTLHYLVTPGTAGDRVEALANSPIYWGPVDLGHTVEVIRQRQRSGLDGADAAVLALCAHDRGVLYTLDRRMARFAIQEGLGVSTLLDQSLMDGVAQWEERYLVRKGLPRVLHSVHHWLSSADLGIASRFAEAAGDLTQLP